MSRVHKTATNRSSVSRITFNTAVTSGFCTFFNSFFKKTHQGVLEIVAAESKRRSLALAPEIGKYVKELAGRARLLRQNRLELNCLVLN